jgi:hypothetical protein
VDPIAGHEQPAVAHRRGGRRTSCVTFVAWTSTFPAASRWPVWRRSADPPYGFLTRLRRLVYPAWVRFPPISPDARRTPGPRSSFA